MTDTREYPYPVKPGAPSRDTLKVLEDRDHDGRYETVSTFADQLDIGFTVTGWWPAIGGAIVITVTTWIVDGILGESR